MAVLVSFLPVANISSADVLVYGRPRAYESVSVGSATSGSAQDGEWALIVNTETDTVLCASGSTPDAGATSETAASSASFPVPPNIPVPVKLNAGDKIDTATT